MQPCPAWKSRLKQLAGPLRRALFGPPPPGGTGPLSHEAALERVFARGLEVKTVIDVGAAGGGWATHLSERFLPDAAFFLIEGFDTWRAGLERLCQGRPRFNHVIAAAGDRTGSVYFLETPDHPTGGHAFDERPSERYKEVPQTTIDHEVAAHGLAGPFMIKIDTHGREGEIIEGAARTLEETNLLMIEVNNFADRGRMRFHELCAFVEARGFRCADIAEPKWRQADNMFWQCDLLFIRSDRPEFETRGF